MKNIRFDSKSFLMIGFTTALFQQGCGGLGCEHHSDDYFELRAAYPTKGAYYSGSKISGLDENGRLTDDSGELLFPLSLNTLDGQSINVGARIETEEINKALANLDIDLREIKGTEISENTVFNLKSSSCKGIYVDTHETFECVVTGKATVIHFQHQDQVSTAPTGHPLMSLQIQISIKTARGDNPLSGISEIYLEQGTRNYTTGDCS